VPAQATGAALRCLLTDSQDDDGRSGTSSYQEPWRAKTDLNKIFDPHPALDFVKTTRQAQHTNQSTLQLHILERKLASRSLPLDHGFAEMQGA
jgi:hypothetical protein